MLIVLYHLFVMIISFYKYARNRYLGDNHNNFVCKESIWMIFISASMSIKMNCYIFLFIENTKGWEWLNPIPIFSIESSKSFTLFLFIFLYNIHDTNDLSNKLWHIFLYLVNIRLEILELFVVGSILVLRDNLLLLTWYTCRIKESPFFSLLFLSIPFFI